jgi:transketolase
MAQAGKIDGRKHTVFSIMGDGEQQEGSIWEAVMEGSHYCLHTLERRSCSSLPSIPQRK